MRPLCKPNRNCLRNKKSNSVKEAAASLLFLVALVELAMDLTTSSFLALLLLQYLANFLPKSLSCGGVAACPASSPASSLGINYTCRSRKYDCHASRRWQIDRETKRNETCAGTSNTPSAQCTPPPPTQCTDHAPIPHPIAMG